MSRLYSLLDRSSIWILSQVTPLDLREPLIGDLFEYSETSGRPAWQLALRSLPHIVIHSLRHTLEALRFRDMAFLCTFALALFGWEYGIAREWAWPFARTFVSLSPLSPAQTCMGAYLTLYFGFAFSCGLVVSRLQHLQLVSGSSTGLSKLMLFAPSICFLLLPTAIDDPSFRILQIFAVLAGLICAAGLWQRAGSVLRHFHRIARN